MPTIFVWKGCRFFFYSNEGNEPPHVHISAQNCETEIWLSDLKVARNHGFADRQRLLDAWRDHFDA